MTTRRAALSPALLNWPPMLLLQGAHSCLAQPTAHRQLAQALHPRQQLPQPPQQPPALQQAPAGRVGQQQVCKKCKVPACPWGRYGTPVPIGMGGCFCRAEEKKIKGRPPPPPHPTT